MIGRRGLIQGVAGMSMAGRGGQTPRRPDQGRVAGPLQQQTVIGPGARNNLRARSVVLFGTGNGLGIFQYNGTPALGNPPIAYEAPPGVTKDPFGNLLPQTAGGFTAVGNVGGVVATSLNGNSLAFQNVTSPPASQALVSGFGSTSGTELLLASGKGTVSAQGVVATLLDSLKSAQAVAQLVLNPGIVAVAPTTTALLEVQGTIQASGLNSIVAGGNLQSSLGDIFASSGNVRADAVGKGLRVKEGINAKQGTQLLTGGTATVANTNVTTASRIFLTAQDNLSTGALRVSSRVAGTSFTITSSVAGDSGSVAWEIFEPA